MTTMESLVQKRKLYGALQSTWLGMLAVIVMVLGLSLMEGVRDAHAQGAGGGIASIVANCPNNTQNRIFTPIVECLTQVVNAVASTYEQEFGNALRNVIIWLAGLSVMLLGVKISFGATRAPAGETMLTVIRICVISYFVLASGTLEYIGMLTQFTSGLTDSLLTVLKIDQIFGVTMDPLETFDSSSSAQVNLVLPGGTEIWHRLDFLFKRILGLGDTETNLFEGMIGVFMVLGGLVAAGPVGGWVATIVTFALSFLFGAFAMAVFTYIGSLIAVMILGAISPIVIPMILFDATRNLFEQWLNQLISYVLQPMILTAFLIFMLAVMENTAVDLIAQYKDAETKANGVSAKNTIAAISVPMTQKHTTRTGVEERESFDEFVYRFVEGRYVSEPQKTTTEGYGDLRVDMPFLSWKKDQLQLFALNFIIMIFLAYIMIEFTKVLPGLVTELIGDKFVPNLTSKFGSPVLGSALRAQQSITQYFRGSS